MDITLWIRISCTGFRKVNDGHFVAAKKNYHLREASASFAAAISACWMLQEENEGYLSLKMVKIIDNFSL